MSRITLDQFGPIGDFDAVDLVTDEGLVLAIIAEPEARTERFRLVNDWPAAQEQRFRAACREWLLSHGDFRNHRIALAFDPGRDNWSEEWLSAADVTIPCDWCAGGEEATIRQATGCTSGYNTCDECATEIAVLEIAE